GALDPARRPADRPPHAARHPGADARPLPVAGRARPRALARPRRLALRPIPPRGRLDRPLRLGRRADRHRPPDRPPRPLPPALSPPVAVSWALRAPQPRS